MGCGSERHRPRRTQVWLKPRWRWRWTESPPSPAGVPSVLPESQTLSPFPAGPARERVLFRPRGASRRRRVPAASPLLGRGPPLKETDPYPLLGSFVCTHDGWLRRRSEKTNSPVSSPPTGLLRGRRGRRDAEISVHLTIGPRHRKRVVSLSIVT